MKVHLSMGVNGLSGKVDGMIYYYHPKLKVCVMRKYVRPELTANNKRTTSIMANLKLINPSEGYKANLKDYIMYYNDSKEYGHKPINAWNNAWLKLMFAMQKAMPETVNLKTLTRDLIFVQNLPCKTVKDAIDAGLLPAMPGYERWDKTI